MLNTKLHNKKNRKILALLMALVLLVGLLTIPAYATTSQIAENGAKVILEWVFWVVVVITIVALVKYIMARNAVGMIITIILGVIVAAICKNPDILTRIGNMFTQDVGL